MCCLFSHRWLSAAAFAFCASLTGAAEPPKGISAPDWAGIRAAYEAGKHVFEPVEGGWQARNPGQRWTTRFDGRGFIATPHDGGWTWGLELRSYGFGTRQRSMAGKPVVTAAGPRLNYQWDDLVQEWWVNDTRGLEHGFTVAQRPAQEAAGGELAFVLGTRGTLRPVVGADARGVVFQDAAGAAVLNYSGLKVWDADGKVLDSHFEAAGEGEVRLLVDERGARYPLTIDPIAQQAYVKASNTGADDQFGKDVAISGDTVVVGAWNEDGTGTGVNPASNDGGNNVGAAYVFFRSGSTWTQQAYLKTTTAGATPWFGISVAVDGDTVAIGALEGVGSVGGAAYIYTRSGTTWTPQAKVKASNFGSSDQFGYSVALSGDTLIVGAYSEDGSGTGINPVDNNSANNAGAAYVFTRSGSTWTQQAHLKASNTGASDNFGYSVGLSGNTAVVGAWNEDTNGTDAGAAYVFTRSGTTWSQQAFLTGLNTAAGDQFGGDVAIDSDTIVVGAVNEDGSGTGINPADNNSAANAGSAYVFVRSGTIWSQQAHLKASNTGASDFFGYAVAVDGDTVVVGANGEDGSGSGINPASNDSASVAGAAYVFTRTNGFWSHQTYLKPSNTTASDNFGYSVGVSGRTVVVGSLTEDGSGTGVNPADNNSSANAGGAYVFTGVGPDPADIAVSGNGVNLVDGDATPDVADDTDFGSVAVAGATNVTRTFTIGNTGASDLNLTSVQISGTNASDFVLTAAASSPVFPGENTTFTVRFNPSASGMRSATISIASDDEDENPFDFSIQGTGFNVAPVAGADSIVTPPDVGRVLPAAVLLANDSDADGDALSLASVQNATNGTASLVNGLVTFTPVAGFSGTASFDYTVSDGQGGSGNSTVTLTVSTTAPISMDGGVLIFTSAVTIQNPITMTGSGRIDTAGTVTFAAGISGSGQIEKTGAGTLVLNAASTFSGGFLATQGEVGIGNDAALGTGTVTLGGAAINALGELRVIANAVVLAANTTIKGAGLGLTGTVSLSGMRVLDTQGRLDVDGPIQGTAAITKLGGGDLILGGNNTFTGGITATEGTLGIASSTAAGSGTLTLAGAGLVILDGAQTLTNRVVLMRDTVISGDNLTLAGPVSVLGAQMLTLNSWLQISGLLRSGDAQTQTLLTKEGGGELVLGPAGKVEVPIDVVDGAVNPLGVVSAPIRVRNPGIPVPQGREGMHISQASVQGRPAMSFQEAIFGDLKYRIAKDINGAAFEPAITVDSAQNVGQFTSLCVVNGKPAISYFDEQNKDLKYVRATNALGTAWDTPVTVMSEGKVGRHSSMIIVAGRPAIAFYDTGRGDLMYVRANDANGASWPSALRLVSDGNAGQYASMKIVDGRPAIAFHEATNKDLKFIHADDAVGSDWPPPYFIQWTGNVGQFASLEMVNGYPAVSYYDATVNRHNRSQTKQNLCFVAGYQFDNFRWGTPKVVDNSSPMLGGYTSLRFINGHAAISYRDGYHRTLKYAWAADADALVWPSNQRMTLDNLGEVAAATSLQLVNGKPGIAYYDSKTYTPGFRRFSEALDYSGVPVTANVRIQGHTLARQEPPGKYNVPGPSLTSVKVPVIKGKNSKGRVPNPLPNPLPAGLAVGKKRMPSKVGGFVGGTPADFGAGNQGTTQHSIGASPGFVEEAEDLIWEGGFTMNWEINDAAGTAGLSWDATKVGGELQIIATATAPISIDLISLQSDNTEGAVPNFNPYVPHTWKIASAGSITGFDATAFQISAARFTNEVQGGLFSISQSGGDLNLVFTPATTTPPDITVLDGAAPLTSGGSAVALGSIAAAGSVTHTFTVRNDGLVPLTDIQIGGGDPIVGGTEVNLSFNVPETDTLAPGAALTFDVTVTNGQATAEPLAASFEIRSSDGDEAVFTVTLSGNGLAAIPEPEITLVQNAGSVNLTDGGLTPVNLGNVNTGAVITQTLTLTNTGAADLNSIDYIIDGAHSIDFRVLETLADTLAPGENQVLTLEFEPSAAGVRDAVLRIRSNDADESVFDLLLTGTGNAAPEIAVETTAGGLTSGEVAPVSFGTVSVNASQDFPFTVLNLGLLDLTGLSVSLSGTHASEFSIQTPLASGTLTPGASGGLVIRFAPLGVGVKTAQIQITSNDADEAPFIFNLSGEGVIAPEISVEQAGGVLAVNDIVGFGAAGLGGSSSLTLTIRNLGSADLTGLALSTSGEMAGDFSIGALSTPAPLAGPAGSTSFVIHFNPSAGGQRRAMLQITNNDSDEGPFTLVLSGESTVAPTDVTLSAATLEENRGANAVVGTLAATDANAGETQVFTFVSGLGDADNASFTLSGDTLRLTPNADFEVKNSYQFRVRSTDANGLFIERAFTIAISNANEAPGFTKGADASTATGDTAVQALGGWAGGITDGDSTVSQTLSFEIIGNSNPGLFTAPPAVSPDGSLAYTPAGVAGEAVITLALTDDDAIDGNAWTTAPQSFTIRVQSIVQNWRQQQLGTNVNTGTAADNGDFDGDGIVNLMEFAFGTNATSSSTGSAALAFNGTFAGGGTISATGQPVAAFEPTAAAPDYRALFVRRNDHAQAGLTYTVQFSANLGAWQSSTVTPAVLADDGTHQVVSVPYPAFVGGKKARFFRVQVNAAP